MKSSREPVNTESKSEEASKSLIGVNAKTQANAGAGWWARHVDSEGASRSSRNKRVRITKTPDDTANYHLMTRAITGVPFFDDIEKEALRILIWKQARFCRIRVLTYAVMGNHFHILTEVPSQEKLREEFAGEEGLKRLARHMACQYSKSAVQDFEKTLAQLRKEGRTEDAQAIIDSITQRMGDLSPFIKEIKERFTRWYNKRHGRRGALWMGRYKSVLVESGDTLRTMALYIDLNSVRAGIVTNPADYRWCGWSDALGESRRARRGICRITECALDSWEKGNDDAEKNYTAMLESILNGDAGTDSPEKKGGQKVAISQNILLQRVRYFSDGVAIGSKSFVEKVFDSNSDQFSKNRKRRSSPWRDPYDLDKRIDQDLHSLRNLSKDVYPEKIKE